MFQIHGNNIYLNRGDAAVFSLTPYNDDRTQHVMEVNEYLRMTVRKCGSDIQVLRKDTEKGYTTFTISSEDTKHMRGRYDYDIKLIYPDGSEATLVGETPNFTPHFFVLEG